MGSCVMPRRWKINLWIIGILLVVQVLLIQADIYVYSSMYLRNSVSIDPTPLNLLLVIFTLMNFIGFGISFLVFIIAVIMKAQWKYTPLLYLLVCFILSGVSVQHKDWMSNKKETWKQIHFNQNKTWFIQEVEKAKKEKVQNSKLSRIDIKNGAYLYNQLTVDYNEKVDFWAIRFSNRYNAKEGIVYYSPDKEVERHLYKEVLSEYHYRETNPYGDYVDTIGTGYRKKIESNWYFFSL